MRESARDWEPIVPNKENNNGRGRSSEATMDHARYYNHSNSLNAVHAPSLSTTTTTTFPLISPRSPVDSFFLPFRPNGHSLNFPASRLRLCNVDLPQALSRAAPSTLIGLGRLPHNFPSLHRLSASSFRRFRPEFRRERQSRLSV